MSVKHAAVDHYSGADASAYHHEDAVFAPLASALPEFAIDGATAVVVDLYLNAFVGDLLFDFFDERIVFPFWYIWSPHAMSSGIHTAGHAHANGFDIDFVIRGVFDLSVDALDDEFAHIVAFPTAQKVFVLVFYVAIIVDDGTCYLGSAQVECYYCHGTLGVRKETYYLLFANIALGYIVGQFF